MAKSLGIDLHGHQWLADEAGVWTTGYNHYEERDYQFISSENGIYTFQSPDGRSWRRKKAYEYAANSLHDGWRWEDIE